MIKKGLLKDNKHLLFNQLYNPYKSHKQKIGSKKFNSAIVLVLILMSLVLVGVIALALLTLVKTSVSITENEIINVRAKFVSQSGIEFAISNLVSFAKRRYIPNVMEDFTYFGEDSNANGALDFYEDINSNGHLDTISCDIHEVSFPSYARFLSLIKSESRVKFASGFLPSKFQTWRGDVFILKVVDTSSKIYILDKNPKIPQIVQNLVEYLNIDVPPDIIENIISSEDKSPEALEKKISSPPLKLLSYYISFFGNPDNSVIEPVPYYERNRNLKIGELVYSWIDYLPKKVKRTSRTPISINTAPIELIYANLANISGTYIDRTDNKKVINIPDKIPHINNILQFMFKMPKTGEKPSIGTLKNVTIGSGLAFYIVEEIKKRKITLLENIRKGAVVNRPLFYNLEEFENFLLSFVADKTISEQQKDLILANVNPNTNLNKFNPNKFYHLDKTDLTNYTTEFTLGVSGIFEIESLAYILKRDGEIDNIVGQHTTKQIVKIFNIIKDTTQEDFESGKILMNEGQLKIPSAEIYPISQQFKNTVPTYSDGEILMSRTSYLNTSTYKNLFQHNTKDYYLFVDGYYSTHGSNYCFPIPKNIFNLKKWIFTLTFWIKPNFLPDTEINPRVFSSFFKGNFEKLEVSYFLLSFLPTNNVFTNLGVNNPFLFYSFPTTKTNHHWWAVDKSFSLLPNVWHFITIVVDSTAIDSIWMTRIYINGNEFQQPVFFKYSNTQPLENTTKFNDEDMWCFGMPHNLSIWNFPAESTFDDIKFYTTALTSEQIKEKFQIGRYIRTNDFIFTSRKFDVKGTILGVVNWNDNSTQEFLIEKVHTYYSLITLQLFDGENKPLTDELYNSVNSPVGFNKNIDKVMYKIKIDIPKEFVKEYVLIDSPALYEVTITTIPTKRDDMILKSFSPYDR